MRIAVVLSVLILCPALLAQHGVAPDGYYPAAYRGDTFTGTAVAADPAADTVTLEYRKGSKKQELSVKLEGGCSVPSKTGEPMHAKDIPKGTVLTALYMPKVEKRNGEKQTAYVAFGIRFLEWQGKPVSEENRGKVYRCGDAGGWSYYRSFAGTGTGAAAVSPAEITTPKR